MDQERLEHLLDLYFDQGLSDETNRELDEEIRSSAQARVRFWQRARLNATLRRHGQEQWGTEWCFNDSVDGAVGAVCQDASKGPPSVSKRSRKGIVWIAAAAAVLLMIGVFGMTNRRFAKSQVAEVQNADKQVVENTKTVSVSVDDAQHEPDDATPLYWVATLRKALDVQWSGSGNVRRVGEPLAPGRLSLDSGLIELQTNRGAVVVLEGPADLQVISDMEVRCERGRIAVNVPPSAHGFLVHTPNVNVVDRGTAFAVHVGEHDEAEVHVIEGMVELVSPTANAPVRELREGQSVEVAKVGEYRDIQSTASEFSTPASATSKAKQAAAEQRRRWQRRRTAIITDPDCLVYYDFTPQPDRSQERGHDSNQDIVLVNRATHAKEGSDGIIVGCDWTTGRWPGKHALGFKNVSDRILFSVPGEYESLSCLLTVRIDAMNNTVNPLLVSRERSANHFEWLVTTPQRDDRIADLQWKGTVPVSHSAARSDEPLAVRASAPILRREQLGNWVHLGFVWDGVGKTLSQYVNGRLVSADPIAETTPGEPVSLALRDMQIGNVSSTVIQPNMPSANICGRFDELIVFNQSLTPTEVSAYYRLDRAYWQPSDEYAEFYGAENWAVRDSPRHGDNLVIVPKGLEKVVFNEEATDNFAGIQVGAVEGDKTTLLVAGGTLVADSNSNFISRVGVAGGIGVLEQTGGQTRFNALQIGLDIESVGLYRLTGGNLVLSRSTLGSESSLEVGVNKGTGIFEVSGGSLQTRRGVTLGNRDGQGTFRVVGNAAENISIGGDEDGDGGWLHHAGSTLDIRVGANGVTPISIEEIGDDGGGDVIFARGAILHVEFDSDPIPGHWDVMKWEGQLVDEGLVFGPNVDRDVWSFEFVDSDSNGTPDTLRVIARPLE